MKNPKSFEDGMSRLQQLLELISSPETSLEQAVKLYSETAQLVDYCTAQLEQAKLKMETIDARLNDAAQPPKEADPE